MRRLRIHNAGCLGQQLAWILLSAVLHTGLSSRPAGSAFIDSTAHVKKSYKLAQALIEDRWSDSWSIDLPCAKPRNHGHVRKTGNGAQSRTMSLSVAEAKTFVVDGLPVYSGCQVYVSHKWKFIYIRQPKSSSTAVLHSVKSQICGLEDATQDCEPNEFRRVNKLDASIWDEYFVFTFVRNPWIRLMSAYMMFSKHYLFRRAGVGGQRKGAHCSTDFETFAKNTNSMRKLCPAEGCCAYVPKVGGFIPGFVDFHINDQSHCVFLSGGESVVDFIGATETIDDDWPEVMATINARAGTALVSTTVNNPNGQGSKTHGGVENYCDSKDMRAMYNETTLYNIAHQYAMDLVRYGFM